MKNQSEIIRKIADKYKNMSSAQADVIRKEFNDFCEEIENLRFVKMYLAGKCKAEDIEEHIEQWHLQMGMHWTVPIALSEYLGFTDEEFKEYLEGKTLESILSNRK